MAALIALVASALVTRLVQSQAGRLKLVDLPNHRSSHARPVPRGGGLGIVAGVLLAEATWRQGQWAISAPCLAGALLVAVVGLMDDLKPQSARLRLVLQMLAAAGVAFSVREAFQGPVQGSMALHVGVPFALWLIALVAGTNAFNFMDGIDGIAGAEAAFLALSTAALLSNVGDAQHLQASAIWIGAAALGFLVLNWPPASIFMGDVGSGFLGFVLVALALGAWELGATPLWTWPILAGCFVVDSTTTLFRRAIRGERIAEAHRSHAYQRLARRWGSHRKVVLGMMAVNMFWLLPWALLSVHAPHAALVCALASLGPLFFIAWRVGAGLPDEVVQEY
jgi:Fuc2NAc and GlcNAc transferase